MALDCNDFTVVVQFDGKKPGFSEETGFLGPNCTTT